ncbi:hypothetical protein [Telmatospirillum siberiense]|uniref:Ricin B lectin domain-containing protein n=1 Tax=Telmatospirillum siberiense TaxID=382514 RepID=A0A2N3Q0M6_9PROT|nr:hypothetical protein [Telmatospirillum siberiense]PKU26210.1 hypothetical protein CWS72_03560 [Telmatospirillum siberiense]
MRKILFLASLVMATPAYAEQFHFTESDSFAYEIKCSDGRYTNEAYHVTRIVSGQTIIQFTSATGSHVQEWIISPPVTCSIGPKS